MFTQYRLHSTLAGALLTAVSGFSSAAHAADTVIGDAETTAFTLAANDTLTITAAGSLTVSGSTVAVTVTGNNASFTNLGSLLQTGTGRAIRDNTGATGFTVTNGSTSNSTALMQSADADVFQMNKPTASVTLNNYGTMNSLNASKGGAQAVDFNAITSGSNIINNYATGILEARDADAVRPGVNGVVNNYGTIIATNTTDTGDDGVDAQNDSGVVVNNYSTGSITGARHGITGGAASSTVTFTTTVVNQGVITGNNGSGINLDGFNSNQTATVTNSGTIIGNGVTGDGDGVDVDGVVNLTNTGTIRSLNAFTTSGIEYSEGVTVGGGIINNSGTIQGSVAAGNSSALGRGITIAGVDKDASGNSIAPQAPYAAAVITNSGVIRGDSDAAIIFSSALSSGFSHSIINQTGGLIQTGSTSSAAIVTSADAVTITNSGTIDGAASGKAIAGGSGNLTLKVLGGSASILGDIAGGSGSNAATIDPGSGNAFTYAGSITNFATVEVRSGHVTFTGASTYTGTTVLSGGVLTLSGVNRLAPSGALQLAGGALQLADAAGTDGQSFAELLLTASSAIDLGSSSLTFQSLGSIASGTTLAVTDWSAATSPGYALRFVGDDSSNPTFLALLRGTTIDGVAATFDFDGTYTNVSAVPLPAGAALLLSGLLALAGGALRRRATIISC